MDAIKFDRLILHPGSPKTGTSGLQNFLDRNRAALAANGYLYPRAGIPITGGTARGHHDIARQLDADAPAPSAGLALVLEQLRSEVAAAPAHTIILSSEEFFSAKRIDLLKQLLRPRQCHVYVCLRPQHEVMNANYYTEVTHNRIKHAPSVFFDLTRGYLRYRVNMTAFARFCDDTKVSLRVFEKGSKARSNPIEDFLAVTGLPIPYDAADNHVEHPTLPAQPTLFLRWLNELEFDQQSFFDIFQSLHRMRPKLPRDIYTMSPERIIASVEACEAENREIRREFLDGLDKPLFSVPEIPDAVQWASAVGEDHRKVERAFFKKLCALAELG